MSFSSSSLPSKLPSATSFSSPVVEQPLKVKPKESDKHIHVDLTWQAALEDLVASLIKSDETVLGKNWARGSETQIIEDDSKLNPTAKKVNGASKEIIKLEATASAFSGINSKFTAMGDKI